MTTYIHVVIQDELGNTIGGGIDVPASVFPRHDDDRFSCARFVDPYGHTFFNSVQLSYFLNDLHLLDAISKPDLMQ